MISMNCIKITQTCRGSCGKELSLSEFYFRKDSNKYNTLCKLCSNKKDSEYYFSHKKERNDYAHEYGRTHKQEISENKQEYFQTHKAERREYEKGKTETDICYKLAKVLRIRMSSIIKGKIKTGSAVDDLGCSVEYLKAYLESKFYLNSKTGETMGWENYGYHGWHIDHIKPLASFDLANREEFLKACHYTNLQPLWAKDHHDKTAKENR
jgi:hypothetical protein